MRTLIVVVVALVASPALAQQEPAIHYGSAPWWMAQPVIASTGFVETEVLANRANFSATFQAVSRTSPDATKQAADKVRALAQTLAAYGAGKVRVQTTFSQRPIYEQYRDKEGNLISNQRSDKIDSYEVNANIALEIRDTDLTEKVYAAVLAARPTTTQPVYFNLEATNAAKTELYGKAIADAKRRAELSVQGAGAGLGAVKLIDPTGRACQTDVLVAGGPQDGFDGGYPQAVAGVMNFPAPAVVAPAPAPPPPPRPGMEGRMSAEDMNMPIQAPMLKLTAQACVVYALR